MMETKYQSTILVIGATGLLGMEICRQLTDRGKQVKGLIRTTSEPARVSMLQNIGVDTVVGDLKDPVSLEKACLEVGTVISTASSTLSRQAGDSIDSVDLEGQLHLIEAAKKAGVDHFIFVSFQASGEFPLKTAKLRVEQHLKASGMSYTILQPTYFMEVWLSPALGFDYPNAKATIYGEGKNRISWIAVKDVAQFAVASLEHALAQNATIVLGGPEALSPLEVVQLFEQQIGKPFQVEYVPVEALQAQQAAATDPLQESFAALMLAYAKGNALDMTKVLEAIPIQLTSVKAYAAQVTAKVATSSP